LNAAQRRQQRRQLAREWPVGTLVTSAHFNGVGKVTGYSAGWLGQLYVLRPERGTATIHPHSLQRAPTTPAGKVMQKLGEAFQRAVPAVTALADKLREVHQ
jgi:hypothetical protein